MDALDFYGLQPTASPTRWTLPMVPELTGGRGTLFGGCGFGASLVTLEQVTGRSVVCATAQFLASAGPPETLTIDVEEPVRSHQVSQARARAHVDGREVLAVSATLGDRPHVALHGAWALRPDVPPPSACPVRRNPPWWAESVVTRFDVRLARGRQRDEEPGPPSDHGRSALWARLPDEHFSLGILAIVADFMPSGISQATGLHGVGLSLDNSLRVVELVPTEWVLLDIRAHAVARGFGHGLVHMWAEDGTLLATASQSTIVRPEMRDD